LKFNIDPYDRESNERIDFLLAKAGLDQLLGKDYKSDERPLCEFMIEEGGKNLSTGEK